MIDWGHCPHYTSSHLAPFLIGPKSGIFMLWTSHLKRIKQVFSLFIRHSTTVSPVASVAWLATWALKIHSLEDHCRVPKERESQRPSTVRFCQIQIPLSKRSYCTPFACSSIRKISILCQLSPRISALNGESQCKLYCICLHTQSRWPENEKTVAVSHPTGLSA